MNINFFKVKAGDSCLRNIKSLYLRSFPPEERRPWSDIERMLYADDNAYNIYAINHNLTFAGFISWWNLVDIIYIEHFAISDSLRNCTIGTNALRQFMSQSMVPVALEAELPQSGEIARRRIDFYQRNGFICCDDIDYVQPPYSPSLPSVPLKLMISGANNIDISNVVSLIHRHVYKFN